MKLTRETLRLLLVDDDELDFELLKTALAASGFTHPLAHFNTGTTALEFFKYAYAAGSVIPHVILMDIKMPLLDGVEVLKRLREDSSFRDLPVIMFSANDDAWNRRESAHLGIFRFVPKSVDWLKVISALDDFIGFYNHEADASPSTGDEL